MFLSSIFFLYVLHHILVFMYRFSTQFSIVCSHSKRSLSSVFGILCVNFSSLNEWHIKLPFKEPLTIEHVNSDIWYDADNFYIVISWIEKHISFFQGSILRPTELYKLKITSRLWNLIFLWMGVGWAPIFQGEYQNFIDHQVNVLHHLFWNHGAFYSFHAETDIFNAGR